MIEGQSPKIQWRPNPDGRRTIEEAVAIAQKYGVVIPDDVVFIVNEFDLLDNHTTARGPRAKPRPANEVVYWREVLTPEGDFPFLIRADILDSDEAIVAVIGHEMYELERIRPLLMSGKVPISYFEAETCINNPGNFHDQAWEYADDLVEKMRKGAS